MASQHLVEDNTNRPYISLVAVGLSLKNLRRHINRCAAHRPRQVINLLHFLREAKIGNDHIDLTNKLRGLLEIVPIFLVESHRLVDILKVHKNICQLHIPVEDLHVLQVLHTFYDL